MIESPTCFLLPDISALLKSPALAVALCSREGTIITASDPFRTLLGPGCSLHDAHNLSNVADPVASFQISINLYRACDGNAVTFECASNSKTGADCRLSLSLMPVRGVRSGRWALCIASRADIPEWNGCMKSFLQNTSQGAIVVNDDGEVLWTNRAAESITGYSPDDGFDLSLQASCRDALEKARKYLLLAGHWQGDIHLKAASGIPLQLLASITPASAVSQKRYWLILFFDVSKHRDHATRLERQLEKDPLTGLLNRNALRKRLASSLEACRNKPHKLAVLFLDLDGFKEINDSLGHVQGDELLRQFASRLLHVASEASCAVEVARLGGDEFILLLSPSEFPHFIATKLSLRLLEIFNEVFFILGKPLIVTASIGCYLAPAGQETASEVLHRADMAMYEAKRSGGNLYSFYENDQILPGEYEPS